MPVVRVDRERRRPARRPLLGVRARHREQRAVSDAHRGAAGSNRRGQRPLTSACTWRLSMFISKKHLSARTVLRGMGATVALPFLDAMVPAAAAQREDRGRAGRRGFAAIEMVHGAAGSSVEGLAKNYWSPVKDGPISTSRSACRRSRRFATTSRSSATPTWPMPSGLAAPEVGGDHNRSSAVFLTASHPKRTEGSDILAGVSIDQIYAQALRSGHAAAVDSAVHRERGLDLRRLRLRLQLRLLDGDLLGIADDAVRRASEIRGSCSSGCSATARPRPSGRHADGRT